MDRLDYDEDGPRDTRGPGWLRDEAGRPYRLEKGTRVYQRAEDRDAANDETYRLAPMVELVLNLTGHRPSAVVMRVVTEAPQLADLFWREMSAVPGESVNDKLQRWEVRNFGRVLEPAAHGVLLYEVRHLEAHRDRGTAAHFESIAEQLRFERYAAETGDIHGSLARVEEICRRAGAPHGGAKTMPDVRLPYADDTGDAA